MRKLIFAVALLGMVNASFATLYNAVNVTQIQVGTGGRVFFQTSGGFPGTRWWTFDGNTTGGKNMFTLLVTSKSTNLPLQFDGTTTLYTGSDRPTADTFPCTYLRYN